MTVSEFINKVGFQVDQSSVNKVNSTISNIKGTATKALGMLGVALSAKALIKISEEFNDINDKIAYAADYADNLRDIQKDILDAANNSKVAYGDMAAAVTSLKQANGDVFPLSDAAKFVEYTTKLGKAAGLTDGQISGMNNTMRRVAAAGEMSSSIINRTARTTPVLIEQLCKSLGVSKDKLMEMADAGELTADRVKQAMLSSAGDIDAAFGNLDFSISDALLNIRNKWGFWVDDMNSSLELTQTIAKTMVSAFDVVMRVLNKFRTGVVWLNERLGGANNLIKLIGVTGGGLFVAMKWTKIMAGIRTAIAGAKALWTAFKMIPSPVKILIAILIVLFLVIDDIVNFMKGNDSVIGYAFEKAGIDAEKMRDKIRNIWNNLKKFFKGIWESIKAVIQPILDKIKAKIQEVFGDDVFSGLGNGIAAVIEFIERITNKLAQNKGLQDFIGKAIVAIAGFAVVIPIIIKVVSVIKTVITVIKAVHTAISVVSMVLGVSNIAMLGIIAAIIAVIVIIVLLVKNWDKIKAKVKEVVAAIKAKVEEMKNKIKEVVENIKAKLNKIVDFFKSNWKELLLLIVNPFAGAFALLYKHNDKFRAKIDALVAKVKSIFMKIVNFFKSDWKQLLLLLVNPFAGAFALLYKHNAKFRAKVDELKNKVKQIFMNMKQAIRNIFVGIKTTITTIWNAVKTFFVNGVNNMKQKATSFFRALKTVVSTVFGAIRNTIRSIWNGIVSFFKGALNKMKSSARSAFNGIKSVVSSISSAIKGKVSQIKSTIVNGFKSAISYIKSLPSQALKWGSDIINNIVKGIKNSIGKVKSAISNVASTIKSNIHFSQPDEGPLSDFNTYMPDMMDALAKGMHKGRGKVKKAVSNVAGDISALNKSKTVSSPTAAAVQRGNTSNRSIVQNINIDNTFNGDKAIQRDSSKIAKRNSDDITGRLARALQYQ